MSSLIFWLGCGLDNSHIGYIVPQIPNARLLLHEKQVDEDGSIIEMKIWSIPERFPHSSRVKYSLVYVREGRRLLAYDNAHGRDHRHYLAESQLYRFTNVPALLRDFRRDLNRIKQEERK
ncbi:MAG: hypothetical protein HYY46_14440 [Deltaproteobacteria bacterium]|nr:hypothetical protein [Deltaproteobacteria bacterium]